MLWCFAGVDTSSRLRVRDEGNAGRRGGPPGDLFVFIQVRSHPKLRREGTTIHVDVQISYVDAILGCSVQVGFSPSVPDSRCLQIRPGRPLQLLLSVLSLSLCEVPIYYLVALVSTSNSLPSWVIPAA